MAADPSLYQQIAERLPLGVVVLRAETDDPRDLRLVLVNRQGSVESGTDLESFVGQRLIDAFPAAFETDLPQRILRVAVGGQPDPYGEFPYGDDHIEAGWFQLDLVPLGDRATAVIYANVTQRKGSEQSLQAQQIEAATLAEIGRIISSTLDIQEVYERFAASVRELIPYDHMVIGTVDLEQDTITNAYNTGRELTPEWAIGKPHPLQGVAAESVVRTRQAQLMQAETDAALAARFPAARAGLGRGMRSTIAVPLLTRDEVVGVLTLRTVEANAYSERHLDLAEQVGMQIAGAIANAWAYDALRQAQQELRSQREETAILAEIGRIISSTLDIEQVYDQVVGQIRRLIPADRVVIATLAADQETLTVAHVAGTSLPGLVPGKQLVVQEKDVSLTDVLAERRVQVFQATTGEELMDRWPQLAASPLKSMLIAPLIAHDRPVGTLSVRAARHNAYAPHHVALCEQLARQIAGAIANAWAYATLKETEEALERSNAELEQFAYVASHDLQEPLRVIGSYVQLLSRRYAGQLDARADRYINRSVAGVERLRALINDLLAYSRVGTRGRPLVPTATAKVMAQVLEGLAVTVQETAAEITWDPLPMVRADATQVGQLFQNLLGNALKYRGERPPRIHIGVERQGERWQFAVRDNGIGLDPAYAERIFLVFQRLHTRDEYPGTGIGLAICQKIVERHGGQLVVESQAGQGATFSFTLPEAEEGNG